MREIGSYVEHLDALTRLALDGSPEPSLTNGIEAALNGQPSVELRRRIPLERRRAAGAFFTGPRLAEFALKPIQQTINEESVIFDPACGMGDLLLECASYLPRGRNLDETYEIWGQKLLGNDLFDEFIHAARTRLVLKAIHLGIELGERGQVDTKKLFPYLTKRSSLTDHIAFPAATHIVLNPPFTLVNAPDDCHWATGKVNAAAIFMENCLRHAKPGTIIIAILPDVLRSGSRYKRWRQVIELNARLQRIDLYGQFDNSADVDVFILQLEIKGSEGAESPINWEQTTSMDGACVGDKFEIRVGSVVEYRDPSSGPWAPFIKPRGLSPWATIMKIPKNRRFLGQLFEPPFVAVRRTSRRGDEHRTIGTIINCKKPVAVDNHLLVLLPRDGTLRACKDLLQVLKSDETTNWLNKRIRCRHLTVTSVANLPWGVDGGSR